MCNRYSNQIAYKQYVEQFSHIRLPVVLPGPERAPNLEPRADIRPTDAAPILRAVRGGLELKTLRWGLIPFFHSGPVKAWKVLTTNARLETITTTRSYKEAFAHRRCLVPADTFYEWTGDKGKKVKWGFRLQTSPWFCFAGIWDLASTAEGPLESFSLITTSSGPDVQPYHDRQPLILDPDAYQAWLSSSESLPVLDMRTKEKIVVSKAA